MKKLFRLKALEINAMRLLLFLFLTASVSFTQVRAQNCALATQDLVHIFLDELECNATLTAEMFLTDYCCGGLVPSCPAADTFYFEVKDAFGNILIEKYDPPIIDHTFLGGPYELTIWAYQGTTMLNLGMSDFTVGDKLPPFWVDCPTDTIIVPCYQEDDFAPLAFDNCTPDSLIQYTKVDHSIVVNKCNLGWPQNIMRQIHRTYLAKDASGNLSVPCEITVRIRTLNQNQFYGNMPTRMLSPADIDISCINHDNMLNPDGSFNPDSTGWPALRYRNFKGLPEFDTLLLNNDCEKSFCNLASTYIDVKLNTCPDCIERTIRFWTVVETSCNEPQRMRIFTQTITVIDTIDPVIICPGDITITTNVAGTSGSLPGGNQCGAMYMFPRPVITDDCCDDCDEWTISVKNDGHPILFVDKDETGTGSPIIKFLPKGINIVTYTANDDCGNQSSCTFTVTVEDKTPPVAICQQFTVVSLSYHGTADMPAHVINSGSHDDCGSVSFLVKRMGTIDPFADKITFNCDDLGSPQKIILQVTDTENNHAHCMVDVNVQNKFPPTISCPANMTVDCDHVFDPANLRPYFGWPTAYGNCEYSITTDSSTVEMACYEETVKRITRNFIVTEPGGLSASCTQTIDFQIFNYFGFQNGNTNSDGFGQIIWPQEVVINNCLVPEDRHNPSSPLHPNQTGFPILDEYPCDQIGFTYTDLVLIDNGNDPEQSLCFKIFRTWLVLDNCHRVNGQFVRWTQDQVIFVRNSVPPVIMPTPDKTVCTYDSTCTSGHIELEYTASDDCTADDQLRWRYRIDYDNDNPLNVWDSVSLVFSGNALNASGNYPIGTHKIQWQVWDRCGNFTYRDQLFTIENCKQPTPVCVDGLVTDLGQTSTGVEVTIQASMLNHASYHTCGYTDLIFSYSADINDTDSTFTCSDLDTNHVQMWVTVILDDGTLLQDFCNTTIVIEDNFNLCTGPLPKGIVSGTILTEDNRKLEDVSILLNGSELPPQITDEDGKYNFPSVNYGGPYSVTPVANEDYMNGLSTVDLVIIQKHILGLRKLNSPYYYIAADINDDEKITASDLLELRKMILGETQNFSTNNSWRFISSTFEFGNPENPLNESFVEKYEVVNMDRDITADFIAVKIGDVSGDVYVSKMDNIDTRNAGHVGFVLENVLFNNNDYIEVPIYAKHFNDITGLQGTFKFDNSTLEFVGIDPAALDISYSGINTSLTDRGLLPMLWYRERSVDTEDNDILFVLKFRALENGELRNTIEITSEVTRAEAYNSSLEVINIDLTYRDNNKGFELLQNQPNPFAYDTEISFATDIEDSYELNIYNVNGKLILQKKGFAQIGLNSIKLDRSELNASGVMYYTISTSNYSATRKMIVLK